MLLVPAAEEEYFIILEPAGTGRIAFNIDIRDRLPTVLFHVVTFAAVGHFGNTVLTADHVQVRKQEADREIEFLQRHATWN